MIINRQHLLLAVTALALLLVLVLPGQSSAQNLSDNPQFQALNNYVNVFLASKKSATAAQKQGYHQGVTSRTESARAAVYQRFVDNRQNAWNANRQAVETYKAAAWPAVEAVINDIRAGYQVERVVLENTLNEEIRMVEEEWDPLIEELQERLKDLGERQEALKVNQKKFSNKKVKAKIKKALKKNNRAVVRVSKALNRQQTQRDALIAEARNLYKAEVAALNATEASEVQAELDGYRQDWEGYDLEMQMEFTDITVPVLAERREAEYGRVHKLRDRGRDLISKM